MIPDPDRSRRCADRGCSGTAEPEQDGDVTFHECQRCGYTFNFRRTPAEAAQDGDTCAVGVPESIRRDASAPMRAALAADQPAPLLSIGMRPDEPA